MTRNGELRGRDHGSNEKATPERAQVLEEEAAELLARGGFTEARGLYEHCLRIYRKLSKRDDEAQTLTRIAQCYEAEADYKEARTYYEEAIALYRASKHPLGLSDALRILGTGALERGNFTFASKLLRECSEICEKEGYRESYTISLFLLAAAEMLEGDIANSRVLQARAERSSGFSRESLGLTEATIRLARAVTLAGDAQRAVDLIDASIRHYRGAGYLAALAPALFRISRLTCLDGRLEMLLNLADCLRGLFVGGRTGHGEAAALRELGSHALRLGDMSAAYDAFKESLYRSQDPDSWKDRAASYLAMGCVASREEHDDLARSLFDKSFATLKEGCSGTELLERTIKASRRVLYVEDLNAAALYFARSASIARSLGEITFYIQAMYYRGCIAIQQADYASANRHLEECLIYYGEVGPERRLGRTLTQKGVTLCAMGDAAKGRAYINKALDVAASEQDEVGKIEALAAIGAWPLDGRGGGAERERLNECIALCGSHIERYLHRGVLCSLADIERRTGNHTAACRIYLSSLMLLPHEGRLIASAAALEGCAIIACASKLHRESARMLGKAASLRRRTGSAPTEANRMDIAEAEASAKSTLDVVAFQAAWSEGESLSTEETVREAWALTESFRIDEEGG